MHYRVTRRSNFIHDPSFCLGLQFIAVKRNPDVLNTSGATSTSASQSSGESSTSQDKGIKGPKFIALAAENSNLKNLLAEVRHEGVFSQRRGREGGGGRSTGSLRPVVQHVTILYTIFSEKVPVLSDAFVDKSLKKEKLIVIF